MGLLSHFSKPSPARPSRLAMGSFTIDGQGRVVSYTLPQSFPQAHMQDIGAVVLAYFRGARQAEVRVKEVIVTYPALKLSARELGGGAIVFLAPQTLSRT